MEPCDNMPLWTLQVVLEAEPREWQSDCPMGQRVPNQLHPFLKTRFENVALDLAALQVPYFSKFSSWHSLGKGDHLRCNISTQ